MKSAVFLLAFATTALAQVPEETPTPPIDPKIDFKVSVAGNRKEFHIGEIIPITLAFSSRLKNRYQLDEANYDRSGRMNYEQFNVTPADGANDPLADYFSPESVHIGGGLTNFTVLTTKPWTIQLHLNEWVRFTKPGEFKVRVSSKRVEVLDQSSLYGASPVSTVSNEITLKIVPADPAWQRQVLNDLVAKLNAPESEPPKYQKHADPDAPRRDLADTLRFLGTADAVREMVQQLRHDDRRINHSYFFGIIAFPDRTVPREALAQALTDPDFPITETFLDALQFVERTSKTGDATAEEDEQRAIAKAVQALPNKRNAAARVTLDTILDSAWTRVGVRLLSPETERGLVKRLISMFDQLPLEEQVGFLDYRWHHIKDPALIPVLKRFLEIDLEKVSPQNYTFARQRSGLALRRWFELDPADARPAILGEITKPLPVFGADYLGLLPEETLPEVDETLAKNFTALADDSWAMHNVASLIARYASGAALPQVLRKLDHHSVDWDCSTQANVLAYVLRVDPMAAKPRIEKTIATRRKRAPGCLHLIFTDIAEIQYGPALEEAAIRALDDSNLELAANAATMLRKFGSPLAETPLWRAYEKWSKHWAGRERELNIPLAADVDDDRTLQLRLGNALFEALAAGKAWRTDEAKLRQLSNLNKVLSIRAKAERYLEDWQDRQVNISVSCAPLFSATVAHYHFDSMGALKEKLSQFPPGTKFLLSSLSIAEGTEGDQHCIEDIRAFVQNHGMSLENEKSPE
jgi:hypothetical protein